jgi:thiol-disulfide isomerase/thioredoxin
VHASETMLGRVALEQGHPEEARQHLLDSAKVKLGGAPKMTLAQDLLDSGERDAVVKYLESCRAFWKFDEGRIDHSEKLIRTQPKPDILSPWRPAGLALIRKKAPAFDLTDLSGKEWKLDQLGSKTVVLAFWNISCSPCRDQLHDLERTAAPDRIVLAINQGDDETKVKDYVAKNRITLPVIAMAKDLAHKYEADALPALAIIDRTGEVAAYSVGNLSPDTLRAQVAKGLVGRPALAAPVPDKGVVDSSHVTVSWRPVPGAESYIVEWDSRDEKGWLSDREGGLMRVVPTAETTAVLELPQANTGRWRVYAVSAKDGAGRSSEWREFVCP